LTGIILAAGYATRLYPLTANQPKALLPVFGKPIIDYIVDEMNTIEDLGKILVISNHKFFGQFKEWSAGRRAAKPDERPVMVLDDGSTNEDNRLGAIGDIKYCIDGQKIDDDLLVIASDNLFTYRLRDAWQHYQLHGEDMILAKSLPPEEDLHRYGIALLDEQGLVVDMEEKPASPKSNIAVFATYFYRRDTVPLFGEYLKGGNPPDAPGSFPAWLYHRKPVRCFLFDGQCLDIGTKQSYEDVMMSFRVSTIDGHLIAITDTKSDVTLDI
jgi:glucose-1-phosphate thymidylyltransferase